jgi:peptide chain release factor 1
MFDKLEDLIHHYEELMNLLSEPDVANDANRFKKLMKEQSDLAPIVETYKKYKECKQNIEDSLAILDEESDEEMRELAKEELKDSKEQVEELEKKLKILLLPKDPNDDKNVIVEIRAGAGGEEAALFAAEIYRMYVHYAENRGWKVETLDADETGIGGMKSVEFMVKGSGAYSILKYESGVHRVQRVPETESQGRIQTSTCSGAYSILKYESGVHRVQRVPETESQGRIQTSTCSVAVMPEAEDVDVKIDDKDIRIDVMRASGNGGQCVNTTDSAVRLTHYPTGIVIYSQTEKSQIQNKEKAFALLRTKLYDMELQKKQDAEAEERRSQIGTGDRAEKIRTYNFPQGRVTDHRINLTLYKLDKILNGDIQEIIDACIAADQAKKLSRMETEA